MADLDIQDLDAWRVAMDLVSDIYATTSSWPVEERYGLISQVRRAAVSVPSNIAEGFGRDSTKEFLRFIGMGFGSLMEVQTQLLIAERLGFQDSTRNAGLMQSIERTAKILNGLKRSLRRKLTGTGQQSE